MQARVRRSTSFIGSNTAPSAKKLAQGDGVNRSSAWFLLFGLHAAAGVACADPRLPGPSVNGGETGAAGNASPGTGGVGGHGGTTAIDGSGGAAGHGGFGGAGGAGGAAGVGGSSGSGGAAVPILPELDLPVHLTWLVDEAIWQPLPHQDWDDRCTFWQADPDQLQFPDLAWEGCGEGCARADLMQGHGDTAVWPTISMSTASGAVAPIIHLSNAKIFAGEYSIKIQRSIDLVSGRTIAAASAVKQSVVGEYSSCGTASTVGSGLEFFSFRTRQALPSVNLQGAWDVDLKRWIWQLPWVSNEDRGFGGGYCETVGMEAGGRSFYLCGNLIRAALTPGSSAISILDQPGDSGFFVGNGAALGDRIVWSELDRSKPGSRLRSWMPDGRGVHTLMDDIPVDTCAVGISDTHVAGFSTAGGCTFFSPEGRLWIAHRSGDGTLVDFRQGPIFWPEPVVEATPVKVWGDHIAVVWAEQFYDSRADRRRLLLARASDWAMRDLRGPAGHEVWEAGLTDEHLYVVFSSATGTIGSFSHVYRYELAHFDRIGSQIVPVPDAGTP